MENLRVKQHEEEQYEQAKKYKIQRNTEEVQKVEKNK